MGSIRLARRVIISADVNVWCALDEGYLTATSPILQIAYALVGAYRSRGVKRASRSPTQTPCLPPLAGEGITFRFSLFPWIVVRAAFSLKRYRFPTGLSHLSNVCNDFFVSSITQHFATHRSIKPRIADKLLCLNPQRVHSQQAANVIQMEKTHDHHLHHPL